MAKITVAGDSIVITFAGTSKLYHSPNRKAAKPHPVQLRRLELLAPMFAVNFMCEFCNENP